MFAGHWPPHRIADLAKSAILLHSEWMAGVHLLGLHFFDEVLGMRALP